MKGTAKILILSAGYGAGHYAAAAALEEECKARGYQVKNQDGFALQASPLYQATRQYYQFCVHHADWLWALSFEAMDKIDWAYFCQLPPLRRIVSQIEALLRDWPADIVLCTYPLFNHIIDVINRKAARPTRHVSVVTDALVISRPWLRSQAELICLIDEYSAQAVEQRYALDRQKICVTSFPTSADFYPAAEQDAPTAQTLRLLYMAQAPLPQVYQELKALNHHYPQAQITLIAGKRHQALQKSLPRLCPYLLDKLVLLKHSSDMDKLMQQAHIYIGKAGAASMFECYASGLPLIVNHALSGQEQGNLELLLLDQCGFASKSPHELTQSIDGLLRNNALVWKEIKERMPRRRHGAAKILNTVEKRFLLA